MDVLDQPTHALILSDLAACLAQEAADGTLDSSDFAAFQSSDASSSTLALGYFSVSDVRAVLAQARFASALADAMSQAPARDATSASHVYMEHVSRTLCATAEHMPRADFDESLQVRGQWPMADELAYAVVEGLLKIGACVASMRAPTQAALLQLVRGLCAQLRAPGAWDEQRRWACRCVPQLHGVARAMQAVAFGWDEASIAPMAEELGALALEAQTVYRLDALLLTLPSQSAALQQSRAWAERRGCTPLVPATPSKHALDAGDVLLEQYVRLGVPLSGQLVASCSLRALASIIAQAAVPQAASAQRASAWACLVRGTLPVRLPMPSVVHAAYEARTSDGGEHAELYASEQLCASLQLLIVGAATRTDDVTYAWDALCDVLSERAPSHDVASQCAALEGAAVLAHVRPTLSLKLLHHIRRWVQAPTSVATLDAHADLAAACMAACIRASGQDEAAASTMYTMLNHVSREAHAIIVHTTLAVLTRLAREMRVPSYTALVVSLLLQRTQAPGQLPIGIVFSHLVPLAAASPRSGFVNMYTALGDAMRHALQHGDSAQWERLQHASLQLARALTPAAEAQGRDADAAAGEATPCLRKELMLPDVLALVIEAGTRRAGGRAAVQGLVHIVAALLAHADMHVHWQPPAELVYLFRNAWIVMVLVGGASSLTAPMPHGDPLNTIALKTPTLVPATARNYLDDDIDTYNVLRHDALATSADALRHALSPVLGHRALETRALSLARLAFVYAVLHVEWRRAACGRPSMALCYLVHPGIATSSVHAPLRAVIERTFAAFLVHVSERCRTHAADACLASEARNMLVALCHTRAAVRDEAHSYLERLVPACPWLFARAEVVATMLELVTLVSRGCDGELTSAFMPQYTFTSALAGVSIDLSDVYADRRALLESVSRRVRDILTRVQIDVPGALHGALLRYLQADTAADGLGATLALDVARGRTQRVGFSQVRRDDAGHVTHALLVQSASLGWTAATPEATLRAQIQALAASALHSHDALDGFVYRCAALLVQQATPDADVLSALVRVPMQVCTKTALRAATRAWSWLLAERPAAMAALVCAIAEHWADAARQRRGLYTTQLPAQAPLSRKTDMSATDPARIARETSLADELLAGHLLVLQLLSDCLERARSSDATLVAVLSRLVLHMADAAPALCLHPLARLAHTALVQFSLRVLEAARLDVFIEARLRDAVCRLALAWFAQPPVWSYGGDLRRGAEELLHVRAVMALLRHATLRADTFVSSSTAHTTQHTMLHSTQRLVPHCPLARAVEHVQQCLHLLQALYASEEARLLVWLHPTQHAKGAPPSVQVQRGDLLTAWRLDPRVAVHMIERFPQPELRTELAQLISAEPHRVTHCSAALRLFLTQQPTPRALRWLLAWAPVAPVDAIDMLTPDGGGRHPMVLQYAMRTLAEHPVDLVFFYVPQLVQTLREDVYGYIAQFILHTSLVSQLFCHQIIWNMEANKYKDDLAEVEDPLKPTLDAMIQRIVGQLTGEAQAYYEREFAFFKKVTGISGSLRPYVKCSKPEKKAKIDEEMAKIAVEEGVYLPSNPDGAVVDIDRTSGRPLQSAAKTPFMATFKVRRAVAERTNPDDPPHVDVWQSAIFKVGDDCRQDMLALQVIAQFKNIFMAIGLDVYLDPYRVTATAPGCGVIDVVPNATSRDEMGRAKINDLSDFYKNRYGDEHSVAFQQARLNFIQSMAAYSVVCHILQIRDRHNGNIMFDGEGHVVHIDFGFLFDIGPGGMRFEPYSFKLSHEMVDVMGGHESPGFAMFEQLVVKAYLACRPFAHEIVATCGLMLGTDLPSFKGKATLDRLHERFKPNMTEREAALHAQWLVKDAYGNMRGTLYDLIQEKQNHIPYRR